MQEKIDSFFTQFRSQTYKKGEILIRAGEPPAGIYYLKKGIVRMYAISRKGEEFTVNTFKSATFFPMSWAINGTENNYYFEAAEECSAFRAPREKVVEFVRENPDVMYDLLSRLYKGMDGVLTRMGYLMAGSAYTRLIIEILIQAKRFGTKDNDKVKVKASEKDLAALTGMSRETISREMRRLKDAGLVTFGSDGIVMRQDQLESELSGGV